MNDELDRSSRLLGEQLNAIAETLPIRDDGRALVEVALTRRRRTRRAAWTVAAAALILVIVAAGTQLRPSDASPFVDTTTTTTDAAPQPGAGPDSVVATLPPLFVPEDGYDWELLAWRGTYGSTISATEQNKSTPFVITVSASPPPQWAPASPAPDSIQPAVFDERPVEMQVSTDDSESTYIVEIDPETTLTVRIAGVDEATATNRVIPLLAGLRRANQDEVTRAALDVFPSSALLVAPDRSALIDSQRGNRAEDSAVTLALWDERVGWGQAILTATPSPKALATVGEDFVVRGVDARMVLVGNGAEPRHMKLEWKENGFLYTLSFSLDLTPGGAIALADSLETPTDAQLQQLWLPTWRPAELPPMA